MFNTPSEGLNLSCCLDFPEWVFPGLFNTNIASPLNITLSPVSYIKTQRTIVKQQRFKPLALYPIRGLESFQQFHRLVVWFLHMLNG